MFHVAAREEAPFFAVLDDEGQEVEVIAGYLGYVATRGFSRHTVRAYAYDMLAFWRWLEETGKDARQVTTEDLLRYIEWEKRRENPQRPGRNVYRLEDGRAGGVAIATITRRPGFAQEFEAVRQEIAAGTLSRRAAAKRLEIGRATLDRLLAQRDCR